MTRVRLINQYFWPDMAATAQLLSDLAEDLAASEIEVTAVAGNGGYQLDEGRGLARTEEWRGVHIRRVPTTSFGRRRTLGRLTDYATYLAAAACHIVSDGQKDVTVCLSTPPFVATLGHLSTARGSRFVYKVEDLYPDVAVALKVLKPGGLFEKVLSRLSSRLLKRADVVVALDEGMASVLRQRGARRVQVIPNWADGQAIYPDPASGHEFRRKHGFDDRFMVLYSGNLGLAHRFDAVCEAARRLQERDPRMLFLFVGGGPRLDEVRALTRDLENVKFLPYQPRKKLHGLYNAASIHLITLRDEVSGLLVPSKYPAALAAGRPVLLVGGNGADLHSEISQQAVGWVCEHDCERVVEVLRSASREPRVVQAAGARGRRLFDQKYSRRICTSRWRELLLEVASRN